MYVNSSLGPPLKVYHASVSCVSIFTALTVTNVALLPLFIRVVHVGYKQWRQRRSVATATTMSHSDVFTFHMVALEMISVVGSCVNCYGVYTFQRGVKEIGYGVSSIASHGQTLFHLLTCVERYLAVIHPVTYLRLRQTGGVRIRNISIGCAWLLCLGSVGISKVLDEFSLIYGLLLLIFSFVVVSFCSISVLCALTRPAPGEAGRNRDRVDQSKQRALHTMTAIMGALLMRFSSSLVSSVIFISSVLDSNEVCLLLSSSACFNPPSSLVLPLLFLHRAGKLPGCKHNTDSS